MERVKAKNPQFDYFLDNLGKLLESRIMRFHEKNGGEVEFFNNFVIVPQQDGFEFDDINSAAQLRNHIEHALGIKFLQVDLLGLLLTQNKEICYRLFIIIKHIEDDIEPVFMNLIGNEIVKCDTGGLESLENLGTEIWTEINKQLDAEISFGTLSLR
jgi:hypothetical protein